MPPTRQLTPLVGLALLLGLLGQPLAALTFVMVSDEELADQAPLVVRGRILEIEPGPPDYHTRYRIALERVMSGDPGGEVITVAVPGGEGPDGLALQIPGAPAFAPGERVLLFLEGREDGGFQIAHFALGAFHEASGAGRLLWVRSLEEAHQAVIGSSGEWELQVAEDRFRDATAFEEWLRDRARGSSRAADYLVDLEGEEAHRMVPRWSHLADMRIRWFELPDSVSWRHEDAISGLPGGGVSELQAAIGAWNGDAGSNVSFQHVGEMSGHADLCHWDLHGQGQVLFDNPYDHKVGAFNPGSCTGVLAFGGVCHSNEVQSFKGQSFFAAVTGFVVTNKGIGCLGSNRVEQLLAHELGHGLGLGHSCGDHLSPSCTTSTFRADALMRATLHNDNRGAALGCDDQAGIRYLYGSLPVEGTPPAAPSGFEASAASSSRIDLAWVRKSTDEDGFEVEIRSGGSFQHLGNVGPGVTSAAVTNLQEATSYELRVRSFKCTSYSPYSEIASATTQGGEAPGSPPAAPSRLTALTHSTGAVRLAWADDADGETHFEVQLRTGGTFSHLATVPAGTTSFLAGGLAPATTHTFRVRAHNAHGASSFSNQASAQTLAQGPCAPGARRLCLNESRFSVEVEWRDFTGRTGVGRGVHLTPDTGYFWFFHPDNVELTLKVLDGREITGSFWVFYGALSNVEYTIRVVDEETGVAKVYHNPAHTFASRGDTRAFPAGGSAAAGSPVTGDTPLPGSWASFPALPGAAGARGHEISECTEGAGSLCLHQGRFQVEVEWVTDTGATGTGKAVPLTSDTGHFWFFNQENVELVVKALDGRAVTGKFWIFYGALSNVEYTITVTDTVTGSVKTYHNSAHTFASQGDTSAFDG